MAEPSLVFHNAPGASSMAVHLALLEVGARFELKQVSFKQKETRTADFAKVNPAGQVPVLLVDGQALTEVAAILYFLARRYPDAKLWPQGLLDQAQAVSWMSFIASTLHGAWSGMGALALRGLSPQDPEWVQQLDMVKAAFEVAEQRLGAGPWAVGTYSIADIHLFRLYFRMRHTLQMPPEAYPGLAAHYDRMLERPAVRRTCEREEELGYEFAGFRPPPLPWRDGA